MHSLRKQTILSTIFMVMGFVFGAVTVLLYTRFGALQKDEVGMMRVFTDFGLILTSCSSLGSFAVLYKFFPYYKDNLPKAKNDLLAITTIITLLGFILFLFIGILIEPIIVKKFDTNSPLVVKYYPYLFVFGFGMLIFSLFEMVATVVHKSYISNFLKETLIRLLTVVLLVLVIIGVIDSNFFLKLYSALMILLAIVLITYLRKNHFIHYSFKISKVTKKFWKKMVSMQGLVFSGIVIITLSQTMDVFILSAKRKGSIAGDFALAQYGANLVSIPSKAMIGGSLGILTQAWKDKNFTEINRIYSRSCINLSLMSLLLFGIIWLNVLPLIDTLGIDAKWKFGMNAMFFICVARCIEASTGVNNMIIATSTFWRVEFFTGIILLALRLPTAVFFINKFGLLGSGYSDVVSMLIYNFIRYEYLRRKFNMQPFNYKNILAILLAVGSYFIAFYSCYNLDGIVGILLRTLIFIGIMITGIFAFKLTPDAMQLWDRWGRRKVKV